MNWSPAAWAWIGIGVHCLSGNIFHRPAMSTTDAVGWIVGGSLILAGEYVKERMARK